LCAYNRRVIASLRQRRRGLAAGAAILAVVAIGAAAIFAGPGASAGATASPGPSAGPSVIAVGTSFDSSFGIDPATGPPTGLPPAPGGPTSPADPTFQPIDVFATPGPPLRQPSESPGDAIFRYDPGRPIPAQSTEWRTLKASGRIVLSNGKIELIDAAVDPMANPSTGVPVADARTLDVSWTRWIVEPPASGKDAKGNSYYDLTYWNLCGPGATTVALYYWQQLTGYPNVTGTAGYFLDPYVATGVAWPSGGPSFVTSNGRAQPLGTYWSGSVNVSGFTAHGRGYLMHLAMAVAPAGWISPGIAIFVDSRGKALYPTKGTPPRNIQAALNWEASGHATDWAETWYTTVSRADPTLARDLTAAVMLDVGRDGVPVVAAVDTFDLPNWQASPASKTSHTRHAIAIVGYDNTANPPTFMYLDTCGRSCNSRGGNGNGQIHVISQAQMVQALTDANGIGFVW
jgi:hypothetical protein